MGWRSIINSQPSEFEKKEEISQIPQILLQSREYMHFYHERASIIEHDGRLSRKEAEQWAYKETLLLWIHEHPFPTLAGLCAGCKRPIIAGQEFIGYGGISVHWDSGNQAERIDCSKQYIEGRTKETKAELTRMGIIDHD